ncbi:MAG: RDD family protein [Acidobacteriaceae bacterium]
MSIALSVPSQIPMEQSPASEDWKQLLAERLEAYRGKRNEATADPAQPVGLGARSSRANSASSKTSRIARAVASRYASQPSYTEVLLAAAEAGRAAQAAFEARAAQAAADEQADEQANEQADEQAEAQRVQTEREKLSQSGQSAEEPLGTVDAPLTADQDGTLPLFSSEREFAARYGSALITQPAKAIMPQFAERSREMRLHQSPQEPEPTLEDLLAASVVEPRTLLPSKLIEFPRELVSSHRARPRLPDCARPADQARPGPGRNDSNTAAQNQEASQLRIFEVRPETAPPIAAATAAAMEAPSQQELRGATPTADLAAQDADNIPGVSAIGQKRALGSGRKADSTGRVPASSNDGVTASDGPVAAPGVRTFKGLEWAAITLDKEPALSRRRLDPNVSDSVPFLPDAASIDRRVMAFAVDFVSVTAAFLCFLAVFAASTPHLPGGLKAVMLAGSVYASLWLLYQMLFFSLSGATAGMLYARIALCTFDDQNPSRPALRRRLAAWWLSCLPLGLGFLWSFLDEDNLCWHDRMTRTYQRSY